MHAPRTLQHQIYASICVLTLVVALRADLHADGQVDDVQMGRCARQAAVLAGARARLAGLVALPADAALVGEAARRTAAHAGAAAIGGPEREGGGGDKTCARMC